MLFSDRRGRHDVRHPFGRNRSLVGSVVGLTSILSAVAVTGTSSLTGHRDSCAPHRGGRLWRSDGRTDLFFELAPFLVTLAGMFLARGCALVVSQESIALDHPFYQWISAYDSLTRARSRCRRRHSSFSPCSRSAHSSLPTRASGRNAYAIGGNEASARLMGLPIGAVKIGIYALSDFARRWPA